MKALFLIFSLFLFTACYSKNIYHGNHVYNDQINNLKIKKTSKVEVQANLGAPSFISSEDNESWYYVSTKMQTKSFGKNKILKNDVLSLTFNKEDRLAKIKHLTLADTYKVKVSPYNTETKGTNDNSLAYFVKNIGKFKPTARPRVPGR